MRGVRIALSIVLGVGLASCYPVTRLQTPTVLEPGKFELALGATGSSAGPELKPKPHISPDLAARIGVVEDLDVGLHLRVAAVELGAKYQITREGAETAVSIAGVIAEDRDQAYDEYPAPSDQASVKAARVALYIGTDSSESTSAWIAPTIDAGSRHFEYGIMSRTEPFIASGVLGGVVVGSASAPLRLLIEVGVLVPAGGASTARWEGDQKPMRLGPGDPRFELTVGLAL